jgi:hypothetical protein
MGLTVAYKVDKFQKLCASNAGNILLFPPPPHWSTCLHNIVNSCHNSAISLESLFCGCEHGCSS